MSNRVNRYHQLRYNPESRRSEFKAPEFRRKFGLFNSRRNPGRLVRRDENEVLEESIQNQLNAEQGARNRELKLESDRIKESRREAQEARNKDKKIIKQSHNLSKSRRREMDILFGLEPEPTFFDKVKNILRSNKVSPIEEDIN